MYHFASSAIFIPERKDVREPMTKSKVQHELAAEVGQVFNLVGECGTDSDRVIKERREAELARAAGRAYESKMQRAFAQCPGFLGGEVPSGERSKGHIVVDPAKALDARKWLKRRFHINENLELSDQGLCVEVIPRVRRGQSATCPKVSFAKAEQFTLGL
jgi:hypothetical protein